MWFIVVNLERKNGLSYIIFLYHLSGLGKDLVLDYIKYVGGFVKNIEPNISLFILDYSFIILIIIIRYYIFCIRIVLFLGPIQSNCLCWAPLSHVENDMKRKYKSREIYAARELLQITNKICEIAYQIFKKVIKNSISTTKSR
jgi:hypothetical protein